MIHASTGFDRAHLFYQQGRERPDNCGILMHEVRSCLYPAKNRPAIVNFMGGLGGRDLSIADAQKMFEITQQAAKKDSLDEYVTWIGLRE